MTWSSTVTRGRTGPRRPLGEPGGFGSLAFSIPLGFRTGRPFSPLSRAISSRWAATVCSRAATLPSNSLTRAFSSVGESASRSPGGPSSQGIRGRRVRKAKNAPPPVLPLVPDQDPNRPALGGNSRHAVLGSARLGSDYDEKG